MKKSQILASAGVVALVSGLLSFSGASADENNKNNEGNKSNSNNTSGEFKGSTVRSHGHPIANLTQASNRGKGQGQDASTGNDDVDSELAWQQMNKAGEDGDRKATGTAKVFGSNASSPITFHTGGFGGLYSGPVQIIPVWVGTWSESRKDLWNSLLGNLVTSLGGDGDISIANQIFNTNSLYFSTKSAATTKLTWSTPTTASATVLANLSKKSGGVTPVSDSDVAKYINLALTTSKVSAPLVGVKPIYVYIGAADTRLSSGFGTAYCGWHTYGTLGAKNIPYIAVQDFTSKYFSSCSAQIVSPNADVPLDAIASILVHEIDESITDADLRTWYDSRGAENADKCAWTFGITKAVGVAKYNYTANGKNYLIQRNWLADNKVKDTIAGTACVVINP